MFRATNAIDFASYDSVASNRRQLSDFCLNCFSDSDKMHCFKEQLFFKQMC